MRDGGAVLATPNESPAPVWTTALTFGVSVAVLVPPHSDPASSLPPQDPMEIYVDDSKLTLHGLQQHYVKLAENETSEAPTATMWISAGAALFVLPRLPGAVARTAAVSSVGGTDGSVSILPLVHAAFHI